MNCRQVQDLVSPYLDHRLTGEQMLDMRQHLDHCRTCQEEYHAVRQVKLLLRSALRNDPDPAFEARLRERLRQEPDVLPVAGALTHLLSRIGRWPMLPPRPQRGRRLVNALALSCVAVLTAAVPFGSSEVRSTSVPAMMLAPGAGLSYAPDAVRPVGLPADLLRPGAAPTFATAGLSAPPRASEALFVQQYVPPAGQGGDAVPLGDDTADGVRLSLTLAGSR